MDPAPQLKYGAEEIADAFKAFAAEHANDNDDGDEFEPWERWAPLSRIDPELLRREVVVAYGKRCNDDRFSNKTLSVADLLEDLMVVHNGDGTQRIGFIQGAKDGGCILQGALVEGVGARVAKHVTCNYTMQLDYDTGHSVDEVAAAIHKHGLFALLWTTHSHMKCETLIPEDALVKYAGSLAAVTVDVASAYLADVKKYKPEIAASASTCERDLVEGGMKFRIAHAPMPRVRALFVLAAPFDFAKRGGTQLEAINEWKERYRGFCVSLGLPSDKSCVDPSRLMYTPRIPKGANERNYEFRIVPGSTLELESVERVADKAERTKKKTAGDKGNASGAWLTPGLADFVTAGHADDLEAALFMEENDPDGVRHTYDGGDKHDFCCPNEDNHTTPTPDDRAFCVENASARENGFWMYCSHATCKDASGGDRAWFLDAACQKYGVEHADKLLRWCPNTSAEEGAAPTGKAHEGGRDWVKRMRVPRETMAVLDEMNRRHAFIVYGGKTRFLSETANPQEFELPYQFLDSQTFDGLHNDTPDVKLIVRKLLQKLDLNDADTWDEKPSWRERAWVWNNWPGRRKYTASVSIRLRMRRTAHSTFGKAGGTRPLGGAGNGR